MDSNISFIDENFESLEDEVLALRLMVNILLSFLTENNEQNLHKLLKTVSFETNNLETQYPDMPGVSEALNTYFKHLADINQRSKKIN